MHGEAGPERGADRPGEPSAAVGALDHARALQAIIGEMAARFVHAGTEELDDAIQGALATLGEFTHADRAYVFRFSEDLTSMDNTHEWTAPGVSAEIATLQGLRREALPAWFDTVLAGEVVHVTDIQDLRADWAPERAILERQGIRATVSVPMTNVGRTIGFVGFDRVRAPGPWAEATIDLLQIAANVMGPALAREDALAASRLQEQRYRALIEHSSDLIVVLDGEGRLKMPPLGESILGYEGRDAAVGTIQIRDLVHPDDLIRAAEHLMKARTTPGYRVRIELRARGRGGVWIPVELVAVNRLDDPLVEGIVLNVRDVRERHRVERELEDSEARFGALVQNIPGAVYRCDAFPPYRDEFVSEAILAITGYPASDFLANRVLFDELILEGHRERTDHELADAVAHGTQVDLEYPILHRDGTVRWISERGHISYDREDRARWIEGALFDITARKHLEQRLEHDASHDPLTGLPNRTQVLGSIDRALARASRTPLTVAALFIDLDRFKLVNDALGHAAGDELLVAFARRLSGVLRGSDIASRTGGDEFVVVCADLNHPAEAEQVAHRIARTLSAPFSLHGREIFVSASIGIAVSGPGSDAAGLLRDADAAAYRAKERGRNRYEVFDEALRAATAAALETESALHRALEEDQLLLHYQPVVDLRTGTPVGFEGLVRWAHPERGLLTPDQFLPAADASGLIVPMGERVVEMACAVLSSLPPEAGLTLAVNLSPRELSQPDLVERLGRAMVENQVPPGSLCLEITESALLDDADAALDTLLALKALGARLAIDDFGTGYSSLSYLRRLPVDIVKIDQSFVAELGAGGANDAVIRGIVSLARELDLEVIAEGIEHEAQALALLALGCTLGQGHLYSPAVPLDQALAIRARH
jgi:diguanylate cyclase (GGDEF)-like protein/PAS domain S-box-containing protein